MENPRTVLILGANGRFGRVAVDAFAAAGWQVVAQSRSTPKSALPVGARALLCDAHDIDGVLEAMHAPEMHSPEVIVNALNPLYTEWERSVGPLTDSALRLAEGTGALLMLPGNVYNFGRALPPGLIEETPQHPDTSKAAIRIALEKKMQAAALENNVRSVVIRAGDFIGGPGPGTWIDTVVATKLHKGRFVYPGALGVAHAWAYLPDLAKVFVAVAERRAQLQPYAVFHYEGLTLTGDELHQAFERVTGRTLKIAKMPWGLMRLIAPVSPMVRAVLEMRYLWDRSHRLEQGKLIAFLGDVPQTGIDRVLRDSLPSELQSPRASAVQEKFAH